MKIVCQQTILVKYHALFIIYEKAKKMKLLSAANCRLRIKGYVSSIPYYSLKL